MSTEWYCLNCGPVKATYFASQAAGAQCMHCMRHVTQGAPKHVTAMQEEIAALKKRVEAAERNCGYFEALINEWANDRSSTEKATLQAENAKLKAELARAREALIDTWALDPCQDISFFDAEHKYRREIAQEN